MKKKMQLTQREFDQFEDYLRHDEREESTIEAYLRSLTRFAEWADGRAVTKELAMEWKAALAEAGYRLRTNPRQLVVQDPDNGIELFYLRPLDIAVYVGRGAIDVGITGQDLLKNSGTAALEHMPLGFGTSTFRFAAPIESPITTV